jgi:hypothetical protein
MGGKTHQNDENNEERYEDEKAPTAAKSAGGVDENLFEIHGGLGWLQSADLLRVGILDDDGESAKRL